MTAPICFVDTETDGVHPDREPWEIAIIRREPDGRETTWAQFVEIDLSTADPFGLRVGRFYDRHPIGRYLSGHSNPDVPLGLGQSVTRPLAARHVARLTHGAHLVGAVPNFDAEILARLLREQKLTPAWHYHLIDVESLAVGYLAGEGRPLAPPWDSSYLLEALGVPATPDDQRHTALGDARWVRALYDAVMTPDVIAVES